MIKCQSCDGSGFYLRAEGRGYYHDGSFGHNDWQRCVNCYGDRFVEPDSQPAINPKRNPETKYRW